MPACRISARDPVQAAAHLIIALNTIAARNADPLDAAVVSTCMLEGGDAQQPDPRTPPPSAARSAPLTRRSSHHIETRMHDITAHIAADPSADRRNPHHRLSARPRVNHKRRGRARRRRRRRDRPARAPGSAAHHGRGGFRPLPAKPFPAPMPGSATAPRPACTIPAYDYNDAILPVAARYLAATAKAALA